MTKILLFALAVDLTATSAWAQRLPAGVVPIHYDIRVAPDLAAAKFTGEETIRVRLDAPSSAIVLNAAEITFKDVRIAAGGKTQPARVTLMRRRNRRPSASLRRFLPATRRSRSSTTAS